MHFVKKRSQDPLKLLQGQNKRISDLKNVLPTAFSSLIYLTRLSRFSFQWLTPSGI